MRDALVGADGVSVRRSAESEEHAFQPSGAHVAVRIGARALARQLVQDGLAEAE